MTRAPRTGTDDVEYQRRYYAGRGRTRRIALGLTASVRRHVAETIDPLRLVPGASVLELGCGLGRFTEALLDRGYLVTALDLSDQLVGELRAALGRSGRLRAVAGRAEDIVQIAPGPFDAVVGFFFLHHLTRFEPVFEAMTHVLRDGGHIAFCEPNAFNPLFYVQMTITPGMSWMGEPSVSKMRPGYLFPVLGRLGFAETIATRHGLFPPGVANTSLGGRVERSLERVWPIRLLSAYRVFRARYYRTTGVRHQTRSAAASMPMP